MAAKRKIFALTPSSYMAQQNRGIAPLSTPSSQASGSTSQKTRRSPLADSRDPLRDIQRAIVGRLRPCLGLERLLERRLEALHERSLCLPHRERRRRRNILGLPVRRFEQLFLRVHRAQKAKPEGLRRVNGPPGQEELGRAG